MNLIQLYNIADENNIAVYHFPLRPIKAMSVEGAIGMDMNLIETSIEEKECLAHELGHCMLGAFYTMTSPLELRSQKEYKATKWAIKKLIPFDELIQLYSSGTFEIWELAEYFEVSEDMIKKAFRLYEEQITMYRERSYIRCIKNTI